MTNEMYEELKRQIFMNGIDAIEDFLGYTIDSEEDHDVIENRMNEVIAQMPEKTALLFYNKYCKL